VQKDLLPNGNYIRKCYRGNQGKNNMKSYGTIQLVPTSLEKTFLIVYLIGKMVLPHLKSLYNFLLTW